MLDMARLERIRLDSRPWFQRFVGTALTLNYRLLPGIEIALEDAARVPDRPVLYVMNHTDRYNYFPFQHELWKCLDRFTATWVKGKYYENTFVGAFMELSNQLPTVSRGYLITRDFIAAVGRKPETAEYERLRHWVDSVAAGEAEPGGADETPLPAPLLEKRRNVLGCAFDPDEQSYAVYIDDMFHAMMRRFVSLNRAAVDCGLDLLIFPQGTRSIRLLPGHIGAAEMALYLRIPIVPVGCNGSDRVYPSSSPWGEKGRIVYRFGEPLYYEDLADFHIEEAYEPFSSAAEERYRDRFQGLTDLATDRIEALLDEPYRRAPEAADAETAKGAERFV